MSDTSFSDFILDLTYINSIILSESISSKSLTITQKMLCHCIVHHKIIQSLQSKLDLSQLISYQFMEWREEEGVEDLSVVDAVAAVKGELSIEVGTSTQQDGKAAKNAWPGLVCINMLHFSVLGMLKYR